MTEQTIKTSCWDTDQDEEEEVEEVYPDQQCSRTVPVSLAYRGRRSRKEVEQRVTSSSTSLSSPISIIPSPIQSPLSIFPSPLSVLPSPSPVSGPLSAPATFSWGKQSPIPHRNSPLHSPFLLSPGQEHFPPSLASSPLLPNSNLTSSPLIQSADTTPLRVTPLAPPDYPPPSKPSIPVGIAVARQRTTETVTAPAKETAMNPQTGAPPPQPHHPIPWPLPVLPAAPLLPGPVSVPDYLARDPMHGAYLGGGGGFWNPYSSYALPFLLPSSLNHYQTYQNQLYMLQAAAGSGMFAGLVGKGGPGGGGGNPLYPHLDPYRPIPPSSPIRREKVEVVEDQEIKVVRPISTKDDSGLQISDLSRSNLETSGPLQELSGRSSTPRATSRPSSSSSRADKKEATSLDEDNISVGTESVDGNVSGGRLPSPPKPELRVKQSLQIPTHPPPPPPAVGEDLRVRRAEDLQASASSSFTTGRSCSDDQPSRQIIHSVIEPTTTPVTEQKQTSGETSVLERTIPERAVHDQVLKRVHDGVHGPSVLRVPEPNSPASQQGGLALLSEGIERLEKAGQVTSRPEKAGQVTSRPEKTDEMTSRPVEAGQLTSRPETTGQMNSKLEKTGLMSSRQEKTGQAASRPEEINQVTSSLEQTSQVTSKLEKTSQLTSRLDMAGKMTGRLVEQAGEKTTLDESTGLLKSLPDVSTVSAGARVESTEDLDLANQLISFATGKPGSPASSLSTLAVASSPHVAASSPFSGRGRDLQQLRVGSPGRVARGGSVDSLQGQLGLLCDVASQQMELEGLQPPNPKINRSRSMETERDYRTVTDPSSKQSIREFIKRRSSRSSDGSSPRRLPTSPFRCSPSKSGDPEDMDAWEISMRLDMADIQKKYREKYRELYRLESVKERRKPAKRSSTDAKNRNSKSPGRGSKPTATIAAAVPTIKINGDRSSTEDEPAVAVVCSEEMRRDTDTADPPSTLLDGR